MPVGVAERALVLRTCGLAIPAAFTTPTNRPVEAALLFIPGSLFCDLNGDFPSWNSYPGTNAYLARQLAERGIAVLRFAKAGPGTGTVVEDQPDWDRHRTWDGRVTIARAALVLLRSAMSTEGLEVPVFVAGHSEGAVVAGRLAAEHAAEVQAAGVVLLAGPALGILGVMREQHERMAAPEERAARLTAVDAVLAAIRAAQPIPDEYKEMPHIGALAKMPPEGLAYLADSDRTDPCATIATVVPRVLIVQGTADLNVTPRDAERLRAARAGKPTDVLMLDGLSHSFKHIPAGTDPGVAFGWPGPCDAGVAEGVAAWIRAG